MLMETHVCGSFNVDQISMNNYTVHVFSGDLTMNNRESEFLPIVRWLVWVLDTYRCLYRVVPLYMAYGH